MAQNGVGEHTVLDRWTAFTIITCSYWNISCGLYFGKPLYLFILDSFK